MISKPDLPLLYDRPQLRYLPLGTVIDGHDMSGQPMLLDAYGRVIWPVTAWLRHLRQTGRKLETVRSYARRIHDFFTVLYDFEGGRLWTTVDDAFLGQWRFFLCGPRSATDIYPEGTFRGIAHSTFNGYLAVVLQFYLYAQQTGWVVDIIGQNDAGTGESYPISIERGGKGEPSVKHYLRQPTEAKPAVTLPPDRIFDEILAEMAKARKRSELAERDLIINEWQRRCTLRRSEVLRLQCHQIPSMRKLEAIEDSSDDDHDGRLAGGALLTIPIRIRSSKKGGERVIHCPLSLLMRTRQWIDNDRKQLLKSRRKTSNAADKSNDLFISLRSWKALVPQSVTNGFKTAANFAGLKYPQVPGTIPHDAVRPHHNRHAAITDLLVGFLDAGMHPTEAMLTVMEMAGIKRWDTIQGYLHTAEKRRNAAAASVRKAAKQQHEEASDRASIDHARIQKNQKKQDLIELVNAALASGMISHDDIGLLPSHPS